jgi:cytochrome c553
MRRVVFLVTGAFVSLLSITSYSQVNPAQLPNPPAREPQWAFPVIQQQLPAEPAEPKKVPGSSKAYTPAEIDNLQAPPDWFPDEHPPAPAVVQKGHGGVLACGSCHLMNGEGHPESAGFAGLTSGYLTQQMADFKAGVRKDPAGRMNAISKEMTDEEVRQAADWFASLKPRQWTTVKEAAMVPKTIVGQGRMRFIDPKGGMEPIGTRIITVPDDQDRARSRDPHSPFIAYVPPGSLAKGRTLAQTGGNGKSVACTTCHGDTFRGLGNVPRLAGLHPIYIARQLYLFKDGSRNGIDAQLMKKAVAQLTDEDILSLSAFLASLNPAQSGS